MGMLGRALYALALRVIASPVGIVVDATSQYFEGTFAALLRERSGGLRKVVDTVTTRLLLVGLIPAAVIAIWAPAIFSFVFGSEWTAAGHLAQIMIAGYLAQFVVVPISRTLTLLERQFSQLGWDTGRAIATSGVVVATSLLGVDFYWCVAMLTVVQVASYGVMYLMATRAARAEDAAFRGDGAPARPMNNRRDTRRS